MPYKLTEHSYAAISGIRPNLKLHSQNENKFKQNNNNIIKSTGKQIKNFEEKRFPI